MIKTVIIEDETAIRKEIEWLLNKYDDIDVVGTAGSVTQGVALMAEKQQDLLLLDIQLKDGNAFDLLSQIGETHAQLVFITAYDHHAINAIKYGALDYLLKPVDEEELDQALERVRTGIAENQQRDKPAVQQQLRAAEAQMDRGSDAVASLDDQIVLH